MLLVIVKANLYGDNSFTTNGNFFVSNYGVKYNLLLTVNNIEILFKFKCGTAMPRSELEVVGITFTHECSNSSPRYMRENHYAILACNCEISYVSNSQDEHNASFCMSSGK